VKLLLAHNANVKLSAQDDMNALHFAAQKGHTEVIRLLVTAGAVTG
jgi:ankyrin repeat protein